MMKSINESSVPPEPPPPKKKGFEDYIRFQTQGDNMNGKTMLGMTILNFSRRTTLHGIGHLAHARHNRARLLWFFIMLTATLGFGINLYSIIDKFSQTPILTTTYPDSVVFEFPDITICNMNPLFVPPQDTTEFNKLKSYIDKSPRNASLVDWMYVNELFYDVPFSSFIISCEFQQEKCSISNFQKLYIFPYGFCYTFKPENSTSGRKMNESKLSLGHRPNLRLLIYKGLDNDANLTLSPHHRNIVPEGALVMIHEADTFPIFTESYLADKYTSINILIQEKKRFQFKDNLRNDPEIDDSNTTHASFRMPCIEKRPKFKYFFKGANISREYDGNHINCIQRKVQQILVKHCKSLMKTMPVDDDLKEYLFIDRVANTKCLKDAFGEINSKENLEFNNQCRRNPCRSRSFTVALSQAKYPSVKTQNTHQSWIKTLRKMEKDQREFYENKTNIPNLAIKKEFQGNWSLKKILDASRFDMINEDFIDRNFMMIKVAPASIFMDKIVESEEYPFSRLLSDIGGCFGLWLGASLVSIFEMFDLCLDMVDVGKWYHRHKIVKEEKKYNSVLEARRLELLRQQKLLGLQWKSPDKKSNDDSSNTLDSLLKQNSEMMTDYKISYIDEQDEDEEQS